MGLITTGIVLNNIGGSIVSTIYSSMSPSIANIISHKFIDINVVLEELDLESVLQVIELYINEIKTSKQSITKAVNNLNEIIEKIQSVLLLLEERCKEHNQKWFSSYRTLYSEDLLNIIITYKKILDIRFNLLIQMIN